MSRNWRACKERCCLPVQRSLVYPPRGRSWETHRQKGPSSPQTIIFVFQVHSFHFSESIFYAFLDLCTNRWMDVWWRSRVLPLITVKNIEESFCDEGWKITYDLKFHLSSKILRSSPFSSANWNIQNCNTATRSWLQSSHIWYTTNAHDLAFLDVKFIFSCLRTTKTSVSYSLTISSTM